MVEEKLAISLYMACVSEKVFTWKGVRDMAHNSTQFNRVSDEEVSEVYERIKLNYPNEVR